jgi:hypothetical protein
MSLKIMHIPDLLRQTEQRYLISQNLTGSDVSLT